MLIDSVTTPLGARRRWRLPLPIVFILLLAVLAAWRPLAVPDEGRYSEISRWMLVSGDWLVPRINGLPFFHKSPLTHWLQAVSLTVFGVTPWVARLSVVLLAGLMLVGVYTAGGRLLGTERARRATLMLGASAGWLMGGQYANHDMGVAAWIASAIWCFALAFTHGERPHAGWARAGFVVCALGLLTKGLIGVVLPGLVLLPWLIATGQLRKILQLPWFSGLALFAAVAVPWFVLAGQQHPELWNYLFGTQQFSRYTASGFNNQQPWWFYLVACLLLMFPWAFLTGWAGVAQWRGWRARAAGSAPQDAGVLLCWIWLVAILLFYSVPRSKLIGYILPVLPPLALLASVGWERALAGRRHAGRWLAGLMVLGLALPIAFTLIYPSIAEEKQSNDVALELACRAAPTDAIYVVGGYPQGLAFMAQLTAPMVVVQDWARVRRIANDNWKRELFEAGDLFDPAQAARLLREPDVLAQAARDPQAWLLASRNPTEDDRYEPITDWPLVYEGRSWSLYQSPAAAAKGPEAAQQVGLPGCRDHGRQQRRP